MNLGRRVEALRGGARVSAAALCPRRGCAGRVGAGQRVRVVSGNPGYWRTQLLFSLGCLVHCLVNV